MGSEADDANFTTFISEASSGERRCGTHSYTSPIRDKIKHPLRETTVQNSLSHDDGNASLAVQEGENIIVIDATPLVMDMKSHVTGVMRNANEHPSPIDLTLPVGFLMARALDLSNSSDLQINDDDHMVVSDFRSGVSATSINSSEDSEVEIIEEPYEIRIAREQAESEALARQLMEEEAMASYAASADFLQHHADQFSQEDFAAIRAAMQEEIYVNEEQEAEHMDSSELSYETLLRIGERIGDVKKERWAMEAAAHIKKLPIFKFACHLADGKDENDSCVKCLVCQHPYVESESLRQLPCQHVFHTECIDQWLSNKGECPYCRQNIVNM